MCKHSLGATSSAVFTEPLFMTMGASESFSGGMDVGKCYAWSCNHGIRKRTPYACGQPMIFTFKKTIHQILSIWYYWNA